jgi:hypothetical protein
MNCIHSLPTRLKLVCFLSANLLPETSTWSLIPVLMQCHYNFAFNLSLVSRNLPWQAECIKFSLHLQDNHLSEAAKSIPSLTSFQPFLSY